MVKRPGYSSEFKAQAVRLVLEEGQQVRDVTNWLLLSPKTLEHWAQAAREGRMVPAQRADEKEPEFVRLRNENRRLCMECDILKKAAAYFAKGML